MELIKYPLKKGDTGTKVATLQEVLLTLLGLNIPPLKTFERQKVIQKLNSELSRKIYGDITLYVVKRLQIHLGVQVPQATGEVDKKTAGLFNDFIQKIDDEGIPNQSEIKVTISGQITIKME